MTKKMEKTADGKFFSQYEKYLRGQISYRELHELGPASRTSEKIVTLTASTSPREPEPRK